MTRSDGNAGTPERDAAEVEERLLSRIHAVALELAGDSPRTEEPDTEANERVLTALSQRPDWEESGAPGHAGRIRVLHRLARTNAALARLLRSHWGALFAGPPGAAAATHERRLWALVEPAAQPLPDAIRPHATRGSALEGTALFDATSTVEGIVVLLGDAGGFAPWAWLAPDAPGVSLSRHASALETSSGPGLRLTLDAAQPFDAPPARQAVPAGWTQWLSLSRAAISLGIAQAAADSLTHYLRHRSRPWRETSLNRAIDDPHIILKTGEFAAELHGAESLLHELLGQLDAGLLALAGARQLEAIASGLAVGLGAELFALCGTSSADEKHNLHRHWRQARSLQLRHPDWALFQQLGRQALGLPEAGPRPALPH